MFGRATITLGFGPHSSLLFRVFLFALDPFMNGAGASNTVEENSSVFSLIQCFDTVGWAAGRASGM